MTTMFDLRSLCHTLMALPPTLVVRLDTGANVTGLAAEEEPNGFYDQLTLAADPADEAMTVEALLAECIDARAGKKIVGNQGDEFEWKHHSRVWAGSDLRACGVRIDESADGPYLTVTTEQDRWSA